MVENNLSGIFKYLKYSERLVSAVCSHCHSTLQQETQTPIYLYHMFIKSGNKCTILTFNQDIKHIRRE